MNTSLINGIYYNLVSIFSGATYSPYDSLNILLILSIIVIEPFGFSLTMSPVCNQSSSSNVYLVCSGFLKYP